MSPILVALILSPLAEPTFTMRLNLPKGSVVKYRLSIDRSNPKHSGEMINTFSISKVEGTTMYMDCRIDKMKIDGKDRTKDLRQMIGNQTAMLPWSVYSRRTDAARGFNMNPAAKDAMALLGEAGIYLAHFQRQEVKPGETWSGSTTATGGCTGCKYLFKEVKTVGGKKFAYFEITNIRLLNAGDQQMGPMKMTVDLATGLPTLVEYKVKNGRTGQVSHFRQTRI